MMLRILFKPRFNWFDVVVWTLLGVDIGAGFSPWLYLPVAFVSGCFSALMERWFVHDP